MNTMARNLIMSAAACLALPALAQNSAHQFRLNIERQPIAEALNAFSQQTGFQVGYIQALETNIIVGPLSGNYSAEQAMRDLLALSGLSFKRVNERTFVIAAPAPAPEASRRQISTRVGAPVDSPASVSFVHLASLQATELPAMTGAPKRTDEAENDGPMTEVIVTAQRRAENLQDVPIAISVMSGADLDKTTGGGLTEALNRVPGVTAAMMPASGAANVVVRGVSNGANVGAGGATTGYYLDAVPLEIGPDLSAYDLSRIEVLRGPQGTLYGVNSISGVVRVLTNDADLSKFEGKGRLTTSKTSGGGSGYRGDAAINVPIVEGKLAARAVAGYEDVGGWLDRSNKKDFNDGALRNFRLKVAARPVDELKIGVSAWHSDVDYDGTLAADRAGVRNVLFDEPLAIDTDLYALTLNYDFQSFSISSSTSRFKRDLKGVKRSIFSGSFFYNRFEDSIFSQEINLTSADDDSAFRWNLGGIYTKNESKGFQRRGAYATLFTNTIILNEKEESEPTAVFAQGHYRIVDALELTVGLRYFEEDRMARRSVTGPVQQASFHETTPHVGLTWYASSDLTAYVSYGEGFRSGDLRAAGVPVDFANPGPDKLHNYEVGMKGNMFDRRVAFDTALYYMKWDDIQQSLSIPFMGTFTSAGFNGPPASGLGFEGSLAFRATDALQFGLTFAWNDLTFDQDVIAGSASTGEIVIFEKGSRINASGEYTYGASADYSFALGGSGLEARLSASANYQSELLSRFLLEPDVVVITGDPMTIGRVSVSVAPTTGRWDATLFVDNVTNEDGIAIGGWPAPAQIDEGTHVRPRTVGAQLEYKF